MPSDKPRITLRLDQDDIESLEYWAKQEFLTVPQLTRVIVKKAVKEWLEKHALPTTSDRTPPPTPDNGEASQQSPSPKATKAKRKGNEP